MKSKVSGTFFLLAILYLNLPRLISIISWSKLAIKMKQTFLFLAVIASFDWTASSPPNFNYDFTGFHQLTKLLTTNCNDIEGQVRIFHLHV